MKSSVENLEPTKVKLTVEVPYEELKPSLDSAYKDVSRRVAIPGFRKGHVPPQVIDARVGRGAVIEQAVNDVLPSKYSQAVSDNELRPLVQPDVDVTEVPNTTGKPGGQLVFTAEVDVVPHFDLPELDGLEVQVDPVSVTDEDVDKELDALRARFATLKPLDREVQPGDFVSLDVHATIDGEEVDSVSDVSYEVGSGSMLDGQDDALVGAKSGDDVTFQAPLRGGDHQGEQADVQIHVISVKQRELPAADDDFAQIASEFDTLAELRDDLRTQVEKRRRSDQAVQARDKLLDQLLEKTQIQLPPAVVDHEASHRAAKDASDEEKQKAHDEAEQDLRKQVFLQVLAEHEDIKVSQQELIQFMIQAAQSMGLDINHMIRDQNQVQLMVEQLTSNKAIVHALRKARVVDTDGNTLDISEFTKDQAEEQDEGKHQQQPEPAADEAAQPKPAARAADPAAEPTDAAQPAEAPEPEQPRTQAQ